MDCVVARVAELVGDPSNRLPGFERAPSKGVTGGVELQGSHSTGRRATAADLAGHASPNTTKR